MVSMRSDLFHRQMFTGEKSVLKLVGNFLFIFLFIFVVFVRRCHKALCSHFFGRFTPNMSNLINHIVRWISECLWNLMRAHNHLACGWCYFTGLFIVDCCRLLSIRLISWPYFGCCWSDFCRFLLMAKARCGECLTPYFEHRMTPLFGNKSNEIDSKEISC